MPNLAAAADQMLSEAPGFMFAVIVLSFKYLCRYAVLCDK